MSFKSILNKTCDIELCTVTPELATGQGIEAGQPFYSNVPCRLRARSVSERRYSDVNYQKATHALYIVSKKFKRALYRVLIEGKKYNMVGKIDLGGAERYLCLYLERYT